MGSLALVLLCGCGAPSPISASAASLLVTSDDLGGSWSVVSGSAAHSFGSTDAATAFVQAPGSAVVIVFVYVFQSTSDAQSGYQQSKNEFQTSGWTAPAPEGSSALGQEFGEESFVGWDQAGNVTVLWRQGNVVASASGSSDANVVAAASEQADKINRAA